MTSLWPGGFYDTLGQFLAILKSSKPSLVTWVRTVIPSFLYQTYNITKFILWNLDYSKTIIQKVLQDELVRQRHLAVEGWATTEAPKNFIKLEEWIAGISLLTEDYI